MNTQEILKRAVGLHQKGNLREAARLYEEILQSNPKNFNALHLLGAISLQKKEHLAALELFDKAIKISRQDAVVFFNRGLTLHELKDLDAALASYDQGILINPNFEEALYNRGNVLQELKRLDEAVASYDKALAINPKKSEAYYYRALALQEMNQLDEAIASYNKAIAINPRFSEALYNRGNAFKQAKRLDEALLSYNKAITIDGQLAPAYNNRGNVLRELNRMDEAIESFNCAISLDPGQIKYMANVVAAYTDLGDSLAANRLLETMISLSPSNVLENRIRAAAYLKLGRWQDAFDRCPNPASPPASLHDEFGSLASAKKRLSLLPSLNLLVSKAHMSRRTVMFAADRAYIDRYFLKAHQSVLEIQGNVNIHLHAMLSSEKDVPFLKNLVSPTVSVSFELYTPPDVAGYTTRRFMRMFQIIQHFKSPTLCLDVDSKLVGQLDQFFNKFCKSDIGIYRREAEIYVNQLRHAAMLYASATEGALRFLAFLINYIGYLEDHSAVNWFSDQMALLAADLWCSRYSGSVNLKQIPNELMSWTDQDEKTLILTLKGAQKYQSDI